MYIYFGWMNWAPYAIYKPFFLVVETDFKFGAQVRTLWQWTVDAQGNENVDVLCCGTIDRVEDVVYPGPGRTFGILYDQYYPFDLFIGEDQTKIALTMYEHPKSDPNCTVIATIDLTCWLSARKAAPDYDPVRALPDIRYYGLGIWNNQLFAMIVPDTLCQDSWIWVTCQDDDYVYGWYCPMTVVSQDDDTIKVTFQVSLYHAEMVLDKNDDYWKCTSWTKEDTSSAAKKALEKEEHLSFAGTCTKVKLHPDLKSAIAASSSGADQQPVPQLRKADSSVQESKALLLSQKFVFDRTVTKVVNDSGQAILCKLEESGTSLRSKVIASVGMGLAVLGIAPLGGFATPVAVYGMLVAGVGLYDALNDADVEIQTFLYPGDEMFRKTSGGLPIFDNNDLTVILAEIKDKVLRLRIAMKEKVGSDPIYLNQLLQEKNLFQNLLEVSFNDFEGKAIQACKFVKVTNLVPLYARVAALADLTDAALYSLSDGQIISDNGGSEALYDTINGSPSESDKLFQFSRSKTNATVIHAYVENSNRTHDIVTIPGTSIVLLKLEKCRIDIKDKYRNSIGANVSNEDDAFRLMAKKGSFKAYSWRVNWPVFGYRLDDLVDDDASIFPTNDSYDVVYVAINGWLPWQRIVDQS